VGAHHLAALAEQRLDAVGGDHETLWFEGRWYTAGELHERATRVAGGLHALGVRAGDRVGVVMANHPDVGVVYQACWRAGAVVTPAIFLLPPEELRHVFTDADVRVVITTAEFIGNVLAATSGTDREVVCLDGPEGTTPFEDLAAADPLAVVDREDADLAALLYTGGTTGRSKGVMLTHDNLWHAGRAGHRSGDDHDLTRTLVPLPLSHSFGLLVTVTGAHDPEPTTSVLMRWFEPAAFVDLVERHRVEQVTVVPTMLRLLLQQPLEERDLTSLRRVVCGSAPLPADLATAFESRVPTATVCEGYGLTETSAAATVNRYTARRLGTVGQALPGTELRIVDDAGEPLPPGTPGEVLVRSPANAAGYWRSPGATAATFTEGWVRTGDVGALDEDGYLTILDRKKDLIIRNGFNVYPHDVEGALGEHPDVASACVVGRPDAEVGEEVVAFVVPADPALDPDTLRTWARERIGGKAYPREIHLLDQLPLTPVMKIDRKALRARL
jgi:long-chain acyl-CoA synthetase